MLGGKSPRSEQPIGAQEVVGEIGTDGWSKRVTVILQKEKRRLQNKKVYMFTCTQKLNQKERLSTAYPPLIHPIEGLFSSPTMESDYEHFCVNIWIYFTICSKRKSAVGWAGVSMFRS